MVEMIGLVTIGALIGLLAWSLAGESESEKKRISRSDESSSASNAMVSKTRIKRAA